MIQVADKSRGGKNQISIDLEELGGWGKRKVVLRRNHGANQYPDGICFIQSVDVPGLFFLTANVSLIPHRESDGLRRWVLGRLIDCGDT